MLLNFLSVTGILCGCVVFVAVRWIYRLSNLHPLSKFPAPSRWACMSQWYEFYWNVIHDGQFLFKIEEWHKKYGSIVRIGPNEISVNDPAFYYVAYAPNYKFQNYTDFYGFVGSSDSFMGIRSSAVHKNRRIVLNPLFSKANITKLDGNIRVHVDKLSRIISQTKKGQGVYLGKLFRCLTVDVISEYAYSESLNSLDGDVDAPFFQGLENLLGTVWFFNFFWMIQSAFLSLPYEIVKRIVPADVRGIIDVQKLCTDQVDEFIKDPTKAGAKSTNTTIFQSLIEGNDEKGFQRPSRNALIGDAWGLLAAGTETSAGTLTSAIFEACLHETIQQKLHDELVQAFPNHEEMTLSRCERLPYLTAFIKENFRASTGTPGRLPRIVPKGGATTADGNFIPGNMIVSMSAHLLHHNPEIYPNPEVFDPDRWLNITSASPQEKYLVPFSKGSRSCVGYNLAYAELYTTLALLFRMFKLSFHTENTMTADNWVDHFVRHDKSQLVVIADKYDD